jgi:plasmid stability protein
MARLTIHHLDDLVAARLRERAVAAGHSMEQEVREILTAACADPEAVLAGLRSRLASHGNRRFSDRGELVRAMRDERSGLA